jgi:hypothetical protein
MSKSQADMPNHAPLFISLIKMNVKPLEKIILFMEQTTGDRILIQRILPKRKLSKLVGQSKTKL